MRRGVKESELQPSNILLRGKYNRISVWLNSVSNLFFPFKHSKRRKTQEFTHSPLTDSTYFLELLASFDPTKFWLDFMVWFDEEYHELKRKVNLVFFSQLFRIFSWKNYAMVQTQLTDIVFFGLFLAFPQDFKMHMLGEGFYTFIKVFRSTNQPMWDIIHSVWDMWLKACWIAERLNKEGRLRILIKGLPTNL